MKRRNLFFLSYTIFLFICFFAKCFFDYPLWGAIVAAITTASCIFSCADIAEVVAVEYGKDAKDFEPLLESALEKCENLDKIFSMREPTMESIRANNDEEASVLLEGPEVIADIRNQLTKIQSGLKWKKRLSKFCNKITSPLIVFGNLSFFCTITFKSINMILVPIQDYLTVFAFGVLMLTQYWGSHVREEHIELEQNYKEANTLLDNINRVILKAFEYIDNENTIRS